jgi:molybdopterin synthase sulfur carrier subunit
MPITVRVPTPLRTLTQGAAETNVAASSVSELITRLEEAHPGFRERLLDDKGKIRRFINIYLNDEDIRFLKSLDTPLKDGDEVTIVPAIAGGG